MISKPNVLALLPLLAVSSVVFAQQEGSSEFASPMDQVVPVSDQGPDDGQLDDDSAAADELTEQRLIREFERYRRLVEEGAVDEADTSAKRIVAMTIRIFGAESLETSKALNNLAIVQSRSGQYDAAIQNFERAVEIIEDVEDRLNAQLVNPLKGLGSAQLSSGRPDLATQSFDRARHITHVNEGPHNLEQVEILESLAEATLRAGDADRARDVLDRIYVLNVRHFENNQLGLLPSLMRRGDWQHRAGYYNDERATYRRVISIIEARLGKDDPSLIHPLRKLGQSFYSIDLSDPSAYRGMVPSGEIYFKRAVRIAEKAPELPWSEYVETQLALADYYIFSDSPNRARAIYTAMWDYLSTDAERLDTRARLLQQPILLFQRPLPTFVSTGTAKNVRNEELLSGTIRVDYTVSPRGRVRSLRTEAIPPEFTDMQRMVHREMRRRVFRPKMVEGKLETSEGLVMEHSFSYRQSDLDALRSPSQEAPEETTDSEPTDS
jgi:tetratricopeptide (TPR) repeat protein